MVFLESINSAGRENYKTCRRHQMKRMIIVALSFFLLATAIPVISKD
jgi:hypothetical protein